MLFTIFCCISTALVVFCILNRINKRTVELAVHAAVHEAKKEFHAGNSGVFAELAAKERELNKARELLKLHEAVPTLGRRGRRCRRSPPAKPVKRPAAGSAQRVRDVAPVHRHVVRRAARHVRRRQGRAGGL